MVKLAQSTIKYQIEAEFETDGIVEKPDIIGAIFGQTEGLLGADLELRELQRTGRIGRIDVDVSSTAGKSHGRRVVTAKMARPPADATRPQKRLAVGMRQRSRQPAASHANGRATSTRRTGAAAETKAGASVATMGFPGVPLKPQA